MLVGDLLQNFSVVAWRCGQDEEKNPRIFANASGFALRHIRQSLANFWCTEIGNSMYLMKQGPRINDRKFASFFQFGVKPLRETEGRLAPKPKRQPNARKMRFANFRKSGRACICVNLRFFHLILPTPQSSRKQFPKIRLRPSFSYKFCLGNHTSPLFFWKDTALPFFLYCTH